MKTNHALYYSFFLVVLVHIGLLALIIPAQSKTLEIVPPTIQGVIVVAELEQPSVAALTPAMHEQEPVPKPKLAAPKATPLERAVRQDVESVAVEQEVAEPTLAQSVEPLVPPHVDASQANNPAPIYPAISRRLREEGLVVLEVLVLANGRVGELSVKQSSGYTRLDETATRAVKNWHFVAAKRGNESVDFWYELPIAFSLNK